MTILCYHAVQEPWPSPLPVAPTLFERHCAYLAAQARVVDLHDAMAHVRERGRWPDRRIALTFDDGFESLYHHAWPVLRRYSLPATVFLVADTLSGDQPVVDWVDDPPTEGLTTLTVAQVLEMRAGGIRFGSHSARHRVLTDLSEEDCLADLTRSRVALEDLLSEPVPLLAYPRGRNDASTRAAARAAGYSHGFTLPQQREPGGPYGVARVGIFNGNDLAALRVKLHPRYLQVRTSRWYPRPAVARRLTRAASRLVAGRSSD